MDIQQFVIIYLGYSVLCAGVGGCLATVKNRSIVQWVVLCFFLGIIALVIVGVLPAQAPGTEKPRVADQGPKAKCRECLRDWHPDILTDGICPECHRRRLNIRLKVPGKRSGPQS